MERRVGQGVSPNGRVAVTDTCHLIKGLADLLANRTQLLQLLLFSILTSGVVTLAFLTPGRRRVSLCPFGEYSGSGDVAAGGAGDDCPSDGLG